MVALFALPAVICRNHVLAEAAGGAGVTPNAGAAMRSEARA